MLKVLQAERAKTAVALPILSYDAGPEDALISDEFRELLNGARGTVGAEHGNNLSEIVAATVMAGVIQQTPNRGLDAGTARPNFESTGDDNPMGGGMGREGVLSQSGSELNLNCSRGEQSWERTGEEAAAQTPKNSSELSTPHGDVAKAGEQGDQRLLDNGESGGQVREADGVSSEGGLFNQVAEDAAAGASPVDTSAGFSEGREGQFVGVGQLENAPRTLVESKQKPNENIDISKNTQEAKQNLAMQDELSATTENLNLSTKTGTLQGSAGRTDVSGQLSTTTGESGRPGLNARDAEFLRFVGDSTSFALKRSGEASAQMLLLRQSFEHRLSPGRDGISAPSGASANNTNGFSSGSLGVGGRSGSATELRERGRAESNPMSRQAALRMLERVQVTLKEAARARDGKTLSINLEPVDLGRIKVDVSLREGALHARLKPENSEVLQKLREHAHELQAALRKLGLDVERVTVTVSGEESREDDLPSDGSPNGNGKGFQEQRNNMPHDERQVVENTFGNELAQGLEAVPDEAKTATTVWRDNWVA